MILRWPTSAMHETEFHNTKLNSTTQNLICNTQNIIYDTQNSIRITQNSISQHKTQFAIHKTQFYYTKLNSQYTKLNSTTQDSLNSQYTKLNSRYTKLNSQLHKTQFAIIHDTPTRHLATLLFIYSTIYSISVIFLVCFYNERKVQKMWLRIRLLKV